MNVFNVVFSSKVFLSSVLYMDFDSTPFPCKYSDIQPVLGSVKYINMFIYIHFSNNPIYNQIRNIQNCLTEFFSSLTDHVCIGTIILHDS